MIDYRVSDGLCALRLDRPPLNTLSFALLDELAASIASVMVEFGFPMGPLAVIDMAGLDVLALTDRVLRQAFGRMGRCRRSSSAWWRVVIWARKRDQAFTNTKRAIIHLG